MAYAARPEFTQPGSPAMAFDAADFRPVAAPVPTAPAPCPVWTAENPDRALALLFVSPQDCDAVDVLTALEA
ncbi:hypothetical protein [Brevundimonas sp.]|uniref:hypothetical protein n=1 Tax=Brevundimonas sp. TaxID=1871086 RepID=UPI002E1273C9